MATYEEMLKLANEYDVKDTPKTTPKVTIKQKVTKPVIKTISKPISKDNIFDEDSVVKAGHIVDSTDNFKFMNPKIELSKSNNFLQIPKQKEILNNFTIDPKKEYRNLQSGLIIDKREGKQYSMMNGKVVRVDNVLTGANVEGNIAPKNKFISNMTFEDKVTPVGTYINVPASHKGVLDQLLKPIPAFGEEAPQSLFGKIKNNNGKYTFQSMAQHKTYNPKVRNKLYEMDGEDKNVSFGCVNHKDDDLARINKTYGNDTTIIVDTKRPKDKLFIKNLKR